MKPMTVEQLQRFAALTPEGVVSVYGGKPGCACGCRGNHRYSSAHRELGSKRRGYSVDDDEVNDRQVKKVLNVLKTHYALVEAGGNNYAAEVDGRLYIVYPVQEA